MSMIRYGTLLLLFSAFFFGQSRFLHAEWNLSSLQPYLKVELSDEFAYQDMDGQPEVEFQEVELGVKGILRSRSGQLFFDASQSELEADWSRSFFSGLADNLFEDVDTTRVSLTWSGIQGEHWGYTAILGMKSSRADGNRWDRASFSDALTFNVGAALSYRIRPELVLGFGVFVLSNPADIDTKVIPYLQIYWKINEQWTLQTRNGVLVSFYPGETDSQEITFFTLWQSRGFHLGNNGSKELGYDDDGWSAGLSYSFELFDRVVFEPSVRYRFSQEATLWVNGREVLSSDMDDGWYYGLQVGYRF